MIVGLSGPARSGKDSIANILTSRHGFTRLAFADALRDVLYTLNPYVAPWTDLRSVVDSKGWEYAKTEGPQHTEVRRLLQVLGTEVGRDMFGQDFWVDQLIKKIDHTKNYVISDCRFPNEMHALRWLGGYIARVERPGVTAVNGHVSETALDDAEFDMFFNNNRGLEDLAVAVDDWIETIRV